MRARRIRTIAVGFPAVYYTYHYIIGLLHSNFMPNYDQFGKTNKVNSPAAGPWDARPSRSDGRRTCTIIHCPVRAALTRGQRRWYSSAPCIGLPCLTAGCCRQLPTSSLKMDKRGSCECLLGYQKKRAGGGRAGEKRVAAKPIVADIINVAAAPLSAPAPPSDRHCAEDRDRT